MCMLGIDVSSQNEISNNSGLAKGPGLFKKMQPFSQLRYKLTGGSSINNLNVWLNSSFAATNIFDMVGKDGKQCCGVFFICLFFQYTHTHTPLHRVTVLMINPSDFHLKQIKKIIKDASKNHSSNWQVKHTYKGVLSPAHHLRLSCLPP